jgi:hypothetical protein
MSRLFLPRRTLLRAAGTAISLPLLEAMMPRSARAQAGAPLRWAALYFPNGTTGNWQPTGTETSWQLSTVLGPLEPFKRDLSVLTGVNTGIMSSHPGHCAGFLSDVTPQGGGAPFRAAVTADQVIAKVVGAESRVKVLVTTPPGTGPTENGQSGVYGSHLSWPDAKTPAERVVDPKAIFDSLFAGGARPGSPAETAQQAAERWTKQASILDYVRWDAARLQARLGRSDRETMEQFLTGVRETERKLARAATAPAAPPSLSCSGGAAPTSGLTFAEDTNAKLDLMALAFQCDATRVASHLFDFEFSQRNMSFLANVSGVHHAISHWKDGSGERGPMLDRIVTFYAGKLAYLLGRLKAMPEAGQTVLARSMIIWGSGFRDGNSHNHDNIPLVIAGGGDGKLRPGRLVRAPGATRLRDLHLTLIEKMGVPATSFSGTSRKIDNL